MNYRSLLLCLCISFSTALVAEPSKDETQIRETLGKAIPGLVIRSITPSSMKGVYEVISNHQETLFVSPDGQFFVVGELYQVKPEGLLNLTEVQKEKQRSQALASLKESDMVVFKPKTAPKATITVFTDVDCGYCRKLHQEVPRLNELGIQVNYAAFPRSGIDTPSYQKLVSVWCAENPQQAMNQAKSGQKVTSKDCKNPIADQFELGNQIGVAGTPAIFLQDGTLIPGYVPANDLARGLGIIN